MPATPALPLDTAGPYVAAAYLVFLGLILAYVGIMASKLARIAREVSEIEALARAQERDGGHPDPRQTAAAAARVAETARVESPAP